MKTDFTARFCGTSCGASSLDARKPLATNRKQASVPDFIPGQERREIIRLLRMRLSIRKITHRRRVSEGVVAAALRSELERLESEIVTLRQMTERKVIQMPAPGYPMRRAA